MTNLINIQTAKFFKKSYAYKMGGTQTIVFHTGQKYDFDDREYYSGRGAKYNSSIRHHIIGEVSVSEKELKEYFKMMRERAKAAKEYAKKKAAKDKMIKDAEKKGIYVIDESGHVMLSDNESLSRTFDAVRLANTLKISVEDASLLHSTGKTYVFAKSEDGNTYMLYHPSLSCNDLSIHVEIATPERLNQFNHAEWSSAPFADLLGQTSRSNHFVC